MPGDRQDPSVGRAGHVALLAGGPGAEQGLENRALPVKVSLCSLWVLALLVVTGPSTGWEEQSMVLTNLGAGLGLGEGTQERPGETLHHPHCEQARLAPRRRLGLGKRENLLMISTLVAMNWQR